MLNLHDYISQHPHMCKQFKVNELLFTEYNCVAEETRLGIWSHNNYFAYVISGKKIWKSVENEYIAGPGDCLFVKKGAHIAHQIFDDEFCVLIIFVSDDFIRNVIQNHQAQLPEMVLNGNSDAVIPLQLDETLSAYYQSVLTYFHQSKPPPKNLLEIKFEELIITLLSNSYNPLLAGYFKKLCYTTKMSISEIMHANFTYNLKLDEYARLCGRSLSHFKRDFIKEFAISPGKWLIAKRLDYSRYLLETTGKSINDISFKSGFENTSHFIRVFKDRFGMPPLQYRNTCTMQIEEFHK